jgi:hypothetical protein
MKSFAVSTALLAMATSAFAGTISVTPAAPAKVRRRYYLPWIAPGKWLSLSTVAQRRNWSYQRSVDRQQISSNMVRWHRKFYYLAGNTTTLAKRMGPEVVTCYNTGTKVCIRSSRDSWTPFGLIVRGSDQLFQSDRSPIVSVNLWLTIGASTLHYSIS